MARLQNKPNVNFADPLEPSMLRRLDRHCGKAGGYKDATDRMRSAICNSQVGLFPQFRITGLESAEHINHKGDAARAALDEALAELTEETELKWHAEASDRKYEHYGRHKMWARETRIFAVFPEGGAAGEASDDAQKIVPETKNEPFAAAGAPRKFCSGCGAKREGAGKFCSGCGAKYEEEAAAPEAD
eukprot:Hpha_TRINITY_DN15917_c5_g7::TRINITY_DN15917_c5_g7_i2::g.74907::m.74907